VKKRAVMSLASISFSALFLSIQVGFSLLPILVPIPVVLLLPCFPLISNTFLVYIEFLFLRSLDKQSSSSSPDLYQIDSSSSPSYYIFLYIFLLLPSKLLLIQLPFSRLSLLRPRLLGPFIYHSPFYYSSFFIRFTVRI
jgi:hypothetical protein